MRHAPQSAIDLTKSFEGLRLIAYKCSANRWTIGYGHTKGVYAGQKITTAQAEAYLLEDIQEAQKSVDMLVTVPIKENEYAALISFVFNLGAGNFKNSTLLKLLNRGMHDQVPSQLLRWNKVNGEESGGLTRRRKAEAALWNTP